MKSKRAILNALNRERYGSGSEWFTRHDPSTTSSAESDLLDDSALTVARRRRQLLADFDHLNAKEA